MNEVILAILTLLEASLTTTYKKYYYWEIKVPNQAFMPFIEVIPVSTNITNRGTWGMANNEFSIQINVKSSLKKYFTENTDKEILGYLQDLVEKVEDRDTNWNLKSTCILWILQDNLKLSNTVQINWDWNVVYNEINLWESYITMASITFTCQKIIY